MTITAASSATASLIGQFAPTTPAKTTATNFADSLAQAAKAHKAAAANNAADSANNASSQFSSLLGGNGAASSVAALLLGGGAGGNTASSIDNQLSDANII